MDIKEKQMMELPNEVYIRYDNTVNFTITKEGFNDFSHRWNIKGTFMNSGVEMEMTTPKKWALTRVYQLLDGLIKGTV